MKRIAFAVCYQARPTVVFLVIISLCIMSVLLSMYYVHTAHLPSQDMLGHLHGKQPRESGQAAGDDSKNGLKLLVSDISDTNKLQVLNNIDIALHIETKRAEPPHLENNDNGDVTKPKQTNKAYDKTAAPLHKALRKEDMWPTHQKKKKLSKGTSLQLFDRPFRQRKDWNGERYIVYLCHSNLTCAGWGDRQHGILSVYLLSLVTNRTFKVEMQNPCPLSKLYHPRILNWKVNQSEFEGLSSTHIYALNSHEFRKSMRDINFDVEYPHDVVYLTTNYDFFYSLKSNPYYKEIFRQKVKNRPRPIIFADLWLGIFKMNKRVVRRYAPALEKAWPSKQHKLVCAHIRFGRNPSIPSDSDIRNTVSSIKPFWEFVRNHSDPHKFRLFVASDWSEFRLKVNQQYKEIAIDVDGDILHIDKTRIPAKKDDYSLTEQSDMCSGFEKVIADQYVLSKCDILLLTYSVFGKSAAYLRRSNDNLYLMDKGMIKSLMLFNDNYLHKK